MEKARIENKLVLISIGYSACHWCHVMEHECFENEEVAKIMNEHFVCIKIDREEHPHIDSLYMSAVQLMNKQGGWPLNCFTLPDGRPIYGGTYFPKEAWMQILISLDDVYRNDQKKVLEYAERITHYIQGSEIISTPNQVVDFDKSQLNEAIENWILSFDNTHGGPQRAPKFPLPNNYQFLQHFAHIKNRLDIQQHVDLTLEKMAKGGIYDQLDGGFARYSVDELWKVPHFEKMLYDNAQLISLYAEAFNRSQNSFYQETAEHCIRFIQKELTHTSGTFYAALDADSEGVEGKFYTWSKEELRRALTENEFRVIETHYHVNSTGYWEHHQYILLREQNAEESAAMLQVSVDEFISLLSSATEKLIHIRDKRIKPGLDNKIITSWNAQMIKALADSSRYFSKPEYLKLAKKAVHFIETELLDSEYRLFHVYNQGERKIEGLLEDYAFLIEAYLALYQSNFEEEWLWKARKLTTYVIHHFSDEENCYFYFNDHQGEQLISRKKETSDNVTPAANSVMAMNLFLLGNYFYEDQWIKRAELMLTGITELMQGYLPGYSNWARLWLYKTEPFHEISITGNKAEEWASQIQRKFHPNTILAVATNESELPILAGKFVQGISQAYVCHNKTCEKPFLTLEELQLAI